MGLTLASQRLIELMQRLRGVSVIWFSTDAA